MISAFGTDIWLVDGPIVKAAAGFHYPTRMAIIRLSGADLFIWSPVALTDELQREIETLGQVSHIIAPNSLHHVFLQEWIDAYPDAKVYAAPGLVEKRTDIGFDGTLSDTPDPNWVREIDQVVFTGNAITTEVVFFHRTSGTVLFTDLLQQLPRGWYSGWRSIIAKLDLMTGPEPTVPRKFRMAFRDKAALSRAIEQVKSWEPQAVTMTHGTPVTEDATKYLERAFSWAAKRS